MVCGRWFRIGDGVCRCVYLVVVSVMEMMLLMAMSIDVSMGLLALWNWRRVCRCGGLLVIGDVPV